MKKVVVFVSCLLLVVLSCFFVKARFESDLVERFIQLIPKASIWASQQEQKILKVGIPLTDSQIQDAKEASVQYPQKVRLLYVDNISLPNDLELKSIFHAMKIDASDTLVGLSLQHGIFIREECRDVREIIVHELVHTAQCEKLGGIEEFINQYLTECIEFGYHNSPLEIEAVNKTNLICK